MLRLGILVSGRGTTYQAVHDACQEGYLKDKAKVELVISSKPSPAIKRAIKNGMKMNENLAIISPKNFPTPEAFGYAILQLCRKNKIDLLFQMGWLVLTPKNVIKAYKGRIINQHPGPIEFGGKGMYGIHVHAAVLKYSQLSQTKKIFKKYIYNPKTDRFAPQKVTWATNHLVDELYDHGDIVGEWTVPIFDDDNPEKLAERVLPKEHLLAIRTILFFYAMKKFPIIKRKSLAQSDKEKKLLREAIEYGKRYRQEI